VGVNGSGFWFIVFGFWDKGKDKEFGDN